MYLYYLNAAKAEYFKNPSGPPAIEPITARPMTLVSYHIGYFLDTIETETRKDTMVQWINHLWDNRYL